MHFVDEYLLTVGYVSIVVQTASLCRSMTAPHRHRRRRFMTLPVLSVRCHSR